ncbi:MAG: mechanosensitive ion channel family protein [Thermoleophilia bacterium]
MIAPPPPAAVWGMPEWAGRLTLVGIVVACAALLLMFVAWLVPRLVARTAPREGSRPGQRHTAVAALATSLRYIILIAALVAIAFALAGGGGVAAVGGGALVAVLVGFASQRLLTDVIAGFFILFEDQYAPGDVVRLEPSGYVGEVETLSLRTTVLIGRARERMIVPNGQITAVRVIPAGRRRFRLELLTRDPDAVEGIVHEVGGVVAGAGGPWDGPPRVVRRAGANDLTRLIAVVEVDVARDADASAWLADAVAARAGDLLVAPPLAIIDTGG